MKRSLCTVLSVGLFAILAGQCARDATAATPAVDEAGLIATLKSDAPASAKDQACQRLKGIGTAKAVPALAGLLADEGLSHSARYALETIPGPEASAALREALAKTTGLTRAGVIDSIGARQDVEAVEALVGLLGDADAQVAAAAASALGRIGTNKATLGLLAATDKADSPIRQAIIDALLRAGNSVMDGAARVQFYQRVLQAAKAPHQRAAAFCGIVRGSETERAVSYVIQGLQGEDAAIRKAALGLVGEIKDPSATKLLADGLAKAEGRVQVGLLHALAQRGDRSAVPAVVALVKSDNEDVRKAAIGALRQIGDASCAIVLAQAAARSSGGEQDAARLALAQIPDAGMGQALLTGMAGADATVRAEIVRALGQRQETAAVPALLKMAQTEDEKGSMLALEALGALCDGRQVGDLLAILLAAKTDGPRWAAEQALIAVSAREKNPASIAEPLLAALNGAKPPARAAILRVVGRLPGEAPLGALRAAVADSDADVANAALRTMADHAGPAAMEDLLKIAADGQRAVPQRVIAIRGFWRLVGAATERAVEERAQLCERGLAASPRPEDKRLGLSQLARVAHPLTLKLGQSLREDAAVRDEAENACLQIAVALGGAQPELAKAALKDLEQSGKSDSVKAEARKALAAFEANGGYIMAWQATGPYRVEGKGCQELFDLPLGPELQGAKLAWKPVVAASDPAKMGQLDLLEICGGHGCVVYVRCRIFSAQEQKVRLEIGSDDGNKVWLNGNVIHAKNVMRAIKPGQDTATAALRAGWNEMLVKVTQNIMGCGLCVRVRNAEGGPAEGLKFEAP